MENNSQNKTGKYNIKHTLSTMFLVHGIMSLWKQLKIVGGKLAPSFEYIFDFICIGNDNTEIHDAQTFFNAMISQAS